ncbi:MAG: hypothetical protein JNJ85_00860 [Candidatus Kapabacteria bacterium]|nr:hypothetical protein [Candidatus Kapabacteria bacterium]
MKTVLILAFLAIAACAASAQTVRLQQRSASGAWTTVQTKNGDKGTFTNIGNGTYRVCVDDQGTTSCADKDEAGKSLTIPQSSPKQTTSTFQIAGFSWTLAMNLQGTTVGWNWGKSATSSKNNAR